MQEIYAWVPYFRELARKVADRGENDLINAAKQVAWKPEGQISPLLKYGDQNIDPFSFFYTIAANSKTAAARKRIYGSLSGIYNMESKLPIDEKEAFLFPQPPGFGALFHRGGQGNPILLWRLFRGAVPGFHEVDENDFEGALAINGVAHKKLTQALFLINADSFLPIDDQTASVRLFPSNKVPNLKTLAEYATLIESLQTAFPGCRLCEINMFAYKLSTKPPTGLTVRPSNCFQVNANVYNESEDHWQDFESGNHVFTGGPGRNKQHPLEKPEPGDVVLVRCGSREGRGVAVVHRNDYREVGWAADLRLHVLWLNKTSTDLGGIGEDLGFSEADSGTREAFRNSEAYAPTFELLDGLSTGETEKLPAKNPSEEKPPDANSVKHPLNQILYGPPGTGKTWQTVNHALAIIAGTEVHAGFERKRFRERRFDPKKGTGQIAMVTFHQNFAYEDFVEGIRPALDGERVAYRLHDGVFKRIAKAAKDRSGERFVLIIDEINRGNIAKIFGELITLIEDTRRIGQKDETEVTLPYSGETFGVPDNLNLIGTMNTADRSIQLLDTALRRRFTFLEMMPKPQHEEIATDIDGVDCTKLLAAINERIRALLDREHQIGHTYLFNVRDMSQLADVFRNRIFPLLQEYFFDDWAKIKAVLGNNAFVLERAIPDAGQLSDFVDEQQKLYERLPDNDPAWENAAQYRKIYGANDSDEPEGA